MALYVLRRTEGTLCRHCMRLGCFGFPHSAYNIALHTSNIAVPECSRAGTQLSESTCLSCSPGLHSISLQYKKKFQFNVNLTYITLFFFVCGQQQHVWSEDTSLVLKLTQVVRLGSIHGTILLTFNF